MKIKYFKKYILFINLFLLINILFSQSQLKKTVEKTKVYSGLSTYRWDIKRLIMERTNNIDPIIIQGNRTVKAKTIIYDEENDKGFAYDDVVFEDKKEGILLTAGMGSYDGRIQEVIATNSPVLKIQKNNFNAKSDLMVIYPDQNIIYFIGNADIKSDVFDARGKTINSYQKKGYYEIIGNAFARYSNRYSYGDRIDFFTQNDDLKSFNVSNRVKIEDKDENRKITCNLFNFYQLESEKDFKKSIYIAEGNVKAEDYKQSNYINAQRIDAYIENSIDNNYKKQSYYAQKDVFIEDRKECNTIKCGQIDFNEEVDYRQSIKKQYYFATNKVSIRNSKKTNSLTCEYFDYSIFEILTNNYKKSKYSAYNNVKIDDRTEGINVKCEKFDYLKEENISNIIEKTSYNAFKNVKIVQSKDNITLDCGIYFFTEENYGSYKNRYHQAITNVILNNKKESTIITADKIELYQSIDLTNFINIDRYIASGNVIIDNQKDSNNIQCEVFDYVVEENTNKNIRNEYYIAKGKVIIEDFKNSNTILADNVEYYKNKELYIANGNVYVDDRSKNYIMYSGKIEMYQKEGYTKMTKNPVLIFKDRDTQAYANMMENYEKLDKANLIGNVIIIQGKQKAYAQWGEYYLKTQKMKLSGNPILVNESAQFNAYQIIVDISNNTMSMVGAGKGFYNYNTK